MAEVVGVESKYTVGTFKAGLISVVEALLSFVSLGWLKPVVYIWKMKTEVENTWINGKKLVFTGNVGDLYKKYIIWLLLTYVTFGIYGLFLSRNLLAYQCEHTHFEGEEGVSSYNATVGGIIKLNLGNFFLKFFSPAKAFVKERAFYTKSVVIDGKELAFTATAKEWKKFNFKIAFLTIITLFIYKFFAKAKVQQWLISKTHIA